VNIDFARPFQYVFEDKDWIKKVLIGGGIFLASLLTLPLLLVGLAGLFAIGGYMIRVARAVADGKENPLPEFGEWGEDIGAGFKSFLIMFVWQLPGVIVRVIGTVAFLALAQAGDDAAAVGSMVMLGTTCIGLPLQLAGFILGYLGMIRFIETNELGSGFKVGELFGLLKSQAINLLLGIVIAIIAGIAAEIVGFIACIVGLFFTIFWAQLVNAHVLGQIVKLHRGSSGAPAPSSVMRTPRPAMR
jgi:hypothetical protein